MFAAVHESGIVKRLDAGDPPFAELVRLFAD
jgi:hypothetical protein